MTQEIIESAYLMGFEPSEDDLPAEQLLAEAQEYIFLSLTI